MKWLLITSLAFAFFVSTADAQTIPNCPQGSVCFSQQQANEIFQRLTELAAAKDLIIKMQAERGTADQALANALKVIEGHIQLHVVNDQIILKKDEIIKLYERVMTIQMQIIENLEKRLTRGKSPLDKIAGVLKTIGYILAGAALGRGL